MRYGIPAMAWPRVVGSGLDGGQNLAAGNGQPKNTNNLERSGAGDGNRTRMASLEGWSSTIELRPHQPPNA